ncbi:MAG TPA: hypothetical protein VEC16_07125 [Alphaproteobacteria bacterium]|nr:hypothetical protein [Alphaproteobacteria bacterium]
MAERKPLKDLNKVGGLIIEELFELLEKKYSISREELLSQLEKNKIDPALAQSDSISKVPDGIPISILRNDKLSSLESIVKYLRENKKLSYNIIGKLLYRNSKTLAVTYNVASKKMKVFFDDYVDSDINKIPFSAFENNLSILESIAVHFKSLDFSYSEIAKLLGKDQRTIWTVCNRAQKKLSEKSGAKSDNKTSKSNNVRPR